ncbi:hypothetical protein [Rugosimonospora africana]|uniref:Uncharacterized protein n=1 Tax=Rugosimonospora africana TaxID=556532 RepID=A0A8J3QVP0_9ACTN|nr:hypothetical protein [Rugosimonospora africana]GIH16952.1 hypothetical protein Raf01_51240 [Rugosimonospora africana]
MTTETTSQLVIAILGLVAATVPAVRIGRRRSQRAEQLRRDLELLRLIPETSPSRQLFADDIERRLASLVRSEIVGRRDRDGLVGSAVFIGVGAGFGALGIFNDGLWRLFLIPAIVLLVAGLAILPMYLRKVPRDTKGNAIEGSPSPGLMNEQPADDVPAELERSS